MTTHSDRLRTLFDGPGWTRFIDRLDERRAAGRPLESMVVLDAPTPEERRAVDRLLRRPTTAGSSLTIVPAAVLAELRAAGLSHSWSEILEALRGPADTSAQEAACEAEAWNELWRQATVSGGTTLAEWLERLRQDGLLKRLCVGNRSDAKRWLDSAIVILLGVPYADEPLSGVAARVTGNSHALDPGEPLATLVLRGLSARFGEPMPADSHTRRDLWGKAGIICDELSAPVLTLGLRLPGTGTLSHLLEAAWQGGMPLHLSTRLLLNADWVGMRGPSEVYICENPSIVAHAARRLGNKCRPLICVDGEPKTAAWKLLGALQQFRTRFHYHGDFDWAGIEIATRVIARTGAQPWRYGAEDYQAGAATEDLVGNAVDTPWDCALRSAMMKRGKYVHEEAVAEGLLADLAQPIE